MLGTVNESVPYSKEWFYCFSSILEVSEVGHMYGGWARQPKRSLTFLMLGFSKKGPQCFFFAGFEWDTIFVGQSLAWLKATWERNSAIL